MPEITDAELAELEALVIPAKDNARDSYRQDQAKLAAFPTLVAEVRRLRVELERKSLTERDAWKKAAISLTTERPCANCVAFKYCYHHPGTRCSTALSLWVDNIMRS